MSLSYVYVILVFGVHSANEPLCNASSFHTYMQNVHVIFSTFRVVSSKNFDRGAGNFVGFICVRVCVCALLNIS